VNDFGTCEKNDAAQADFRFLNLFGRKIWVITDSHRLLIHTYRTAEHQPDCLRGELTSQEIKKYVAMCLKPGKRTGPDRCPNELTKTITDEEFQIVKMWVSEILREDTS